MSAINTKRKPIGKTTRFEVFKRDLFICQYCGAKPPKVILEVDHILPVSKGGLNLMSNLITSCFDCNRGKRDKLLTTLPHVEKMELLMIKEEQYRQYIKFNKQLEKRIINEIEEVNELYSFYHNDWVLSAKFKDSSVRLFINKLGVHEVIDAMRIASTRGLDSSAAIKYFCGICHNKIKENGHL